MVGNDNNNDNKRNVVGKNSKMKSMIKKYNNKVKTGIRKIRGKKKWAKGIKGEMNLRKGTEEVEAELR